MDITKLEPGNKEEINVFLKSLKGTRDLYDYDYDSGVFVLKRSLDMLFPANYGFIPKTHHVDAEMMDVLILGDRPFQQGTVVQARPIGIIRLKGNIPDDVLIALALGDKKHERIKDLNQLNDAMMVELKDFIEKLKNKKVEKTFDSERAKRAVERSIELYKKHDD